MAADDVGLPVTAGRIRRRGCAESSRPSCRPLLGPDLAAALMRQVLALETLPSVAPIANFLRG